MIYDRSHGKPDTPASPERLAETAKQVHELIDDARKAGRINRFNRNWKLTEVLPDDAEGNGILRAQPIQRHWRGQPEAAAIRHVQSLEFVEVREGIRVNVDRGDYTSIQNPQTPVRVVDSILLPDNVPDTRQNGALSDLPMTATPDIPRLAEPVDAGTCSEIETVLQALRKQLSGW